MDTAPFKSLMLYDGFATVEAGMDSDKNPLLLQKNQLAFLANGTVRGGFATDRPPYSKTHLSFVWPSDEVQEAVEQGLFQGAAYYQPDSGDQSLIAQIGGRLFQFTISINEVTVREITAPSDPNPDTSTQAWLWQSENYMLVFDGASLPVFFDGNSSRRSYGPSVLLAIATASTFPAANAVPAIGDFVTLTLDRPWPGPFNVPVLFNGEYYQPIENTAGYIVSLTSLFSNAVEAINVNDAIIIRPGIAGVVANPLVLSGASYTANSITLAITLTSNYTGGVNPSTTTTVFHATIILFGKIWRVIQAIGPNIQVTPKESGVLPASLASGTQLSFAASSDPNVTAGVVAVADTAPGIGGTVQLTLNAAYTGPPNQIVYLGTGQYTILAQPANPSGNSVDLINLSDPGTTYTFPLDIVSVPELPAGRMGAYGLGQNWISLVDGLSFIAADVSRGPSGTPANGYRDAVLKTVDTTFRGGNFAIPGAGNVITSVTFTANLDTSLGQGSLQIGTAKFMASCQAPFNFENLQTNDSPILTYSLIGSGPLGQNSTILVNSDVYFRSTFGLGSFLTARRDFSRPGNTPMSSEMVRVIALDIQALLSYGSSITFDNRFLVTCSPQPSSQGVIHAGLISMNLDTLSSLREKQPPVYDGLWTGINVLQLLGGFFNGTERAFAFTFNVALSKIELYELLPTGESHFDNGVTPIVWSFETASLLNKDVKPSNQLVSLRDFEFAVDDVVGMVRFQFYYKPDVGGCWVPWHSFSICADIAGEAQYFPRLGLGEPSSEACDPILKTPLRDCRTVQIKAIITGHCNFLRGRIAAVTIPEPKFVPPICDVFETVTVD